jgi:hypothetical protein
MLLHGLSRRPSFKKLIAEFKDIVYLNFADDGNILGPPERAAAAARRHIELLVAGGGNNKPSKNWISSPSAASLQHPAILALIDEGFNVASVDDREPDG